MREIIITFPDDNKKSFPAGITGFDIAKSISQSLLNKALAIKVKKSKGEVSIVMSKT